MQYGKFRSNGGTAFVTPIEQEWVDTQKGCNSIEPAQRVKNEKLKSEK